MANQLFQIKTHEALVEELQSDNRLRRVLGPDPALEPGRRRDHRHRHLRADRRRGARQTGPALMLSFVVSGITCVFRGAVLRGVRFDGARSRDRRTPTRTPRSGELFAWIIGWDLILEYAVASATVAHGWSHYFQDFLRYLPRRIAARFSRTRLSTTI